MTPYPPYTTTVIGSHGVPRWFEFLGALVQSGRLSRPEIADAQFRATQAAILEQEVAGIDIVTGGEMHRRWNNRHAPLNAMLNHFWQKLPGFAKDAKAEYGLVTRPRALTAKDRGVFHPAAVCMGNITDDADLGLVDEFKMVSAFATRPVKITVTSPYALAKLAWNEHYPDLPAMMTDLAKLLQRNLARLAAAGCLHVQIDEPMLGLADEREAKAAVEAINLATEGLAARLHVSLHACQGNYAVGTFYDGQLGYRYFQGASYPADHIAAIVCDSLLIEGDMVEHFRGRLGNRQLGVGAVDVQDVAIETGEAVAERIARLRWLAPEQTIVTSSCGMNHLPRHICFGKLLALAEAKRLLSTRAH
jgi:5-methyltetrahydropteroyltriglutamate--homocysteine methyltransferase